MIRGAWSLAFWTATFTSNPFYWGRVHLIHLINAKLPLTSSSNYYSLRIHQGTIIEVTEQDSYLYDAEATSLDSDFPLDEHRGKLLNLNGRVLLPAFVDSHMHMDKAFSLAFAPNISGTLEEAIGSYLSALPSLSYENIKNRIMRTALQALSFGTTSMRTHIDFDTKMEKKSMFQALLAALEVKEQLKNYIHIQIFPMCPFYELGKHDLDFLEQALQMGVDGIGGAPHLGTNPKENISRIFQLAIKHDKLIDLHTDESDDPRVRTISTIINQTEKNDYQGKVTVGHLCSLSSMEEREAFEIIDGLHKANISVVTLPSSNMYLQGREDRGIVRRGVTRIRGLSNAGVQIATASDNINDPFHPFGRGDLVMIGLLTGYAAHFGSPEEQFKLIQMMTEIPAAIMGLGTYGLQVGKSANFVILDAGSIEEVFTNIPDRRWVFRQNHWTIRANGKPVFQNNDLNKLWEAIHVGV